jgi:hypothetical protein
LPDGGRSLKRLHGSTALEFGCTGFKRKPDLKDFTGLDPVCPKCGPYEASEGIYPCPSQGKNGESKFKSLLDTDRYLNISFILGKQVLDHRMFFESAFLAKR